MLNNVIKLLKKLVLPRCIGICFNLKPFCSIVFTSAPPSSPYPITTSKPSTLAASAIAKR
jgi:hypothetical protein